MSGTSLDGLDIASCHFYLINGKWSYEIEAAETIEYSAEERLRLQRGYLASGIELTLLDHEFGKFTGLEVKKFLSRNVLKTDFISSHGHTIFHQPEKGFTVQIGNGNDISAVTKLPVVCDFRSMDVALGGQGAPLVPIGDKLLFPEYEMCLNLGGIANISFDILDKRVAFDICPVNIVLNELAEKTGQAFDAGGGTARKGQLIESLLRQLEDLDYYKREFPKSMGKEWIDASVFPLLNHENIANLLYTFCVHISMQINAVTKKFAEGKNKKVLVTGGGAFNTFLTELLRKHASENIEYVLPDINTILFKEALIFAFLGVLRVRNESNCLAAVTGAGHDAIGGALYGNFNALKNY